MSSGFRLQGYLRPWGAPLWLSDPSNGGRSSKGNSPILAHARASLPPFSVSITVGHRVYRILCSGR